MCHFEFEGHLSIFEQPEFTVKADLVKALDENDVPADIKLVLELGMHLEEHLAVLNKSEGRLLS